MSASRTNFSDPAMRDASARNPAQSLSVQWTALQDAAAAVAAMAGLAPERTSAQIRNFPALIKDAGGWRFELAEQTIADLTAMMQPGVTALLAVNARGQDAKVPALTLWHEFHRARTAVLGLVPDTGTLGPRRSA
ncbi:hypothetical protein [Parerythrobacter jejuensis]|nr:hypothetical protein [Parerythrobacter jejuensis]